MAGRGSGLPSVMQHDFSRIAAPRIQRSVFNRTHGHKTTFDAGYLIPFLVDEILPGDTINLTANIFARLMTLQYPIMDNVFLDTFYFFVPNRLIWDNWEEFNGAYSSSGANPTDYVVPVLEISAEDPATVASGSLADYFGLPIGKTFQSGDDPIALPFRAYNLIWNEWFRDQNLQNEEVVNTDDGPDAVSDYVLLRRNKRHDYFTSCLPYPQKGDSVPLPLGTSAPVIGNGTTIGVTNGTTNFGLSHNDTTGFNGFIRAYDGNFGDPQGTGPEGTAAVGNLSIGLALTNSGMIADLSDATAATVNQLREAFAVQQILEADARGGTRYVEHLRAHWGVISPDFRLQRPEYLGGSSQRVEVRGVAQTTFQASPTIEDAKGSLAAYSQVGSRSGFNRSFVEHGYIIGLVNVRADLTYQQGIRRMWKRSTRFDFYMPELAHLGEQAVLNQEIWMTSGNNTVNEAIFGYQERWAEYRYFPSLVTGLFRSDAVGTLDPWHLSIDFSALPVLNAAFIQDDPPIDRVSAVPAEPHVLFDSFIEMKHARPMPVYSIPGLTRL